MNSHQIEFIQSLMDHPMTAAELADFQKHHGDDQYLMLDDHPQAGRQIMLFYTGCNGRQLRDYIATYRPEVYDKYYLVQLYTQVLAVQGIWNKEFEFPWIIPALFNHCDVLIYNPIGANYREYSDQNVLRYLNHSAVALSYAGPHHGCWWAICPLFGEDCLWKYYRDGSTDDAIFTRFSNGSFDCEFPERFKLQMAWLKGHESGTDTAIGAFIEKYHRECKMWFTLNHPSYHVVGYICDTLLAKLGFALLGAEHAIGLPTNRCPLTDHYPETHYEFDYYKFRYPLRYPNGHGGMAFFQKLITDARARWVEKGKP